MTTIDITDYTQELVQSDRDYEWTAYQAAHAVLVQAMDYEAECWDALKAAGEAHNALIALAEECGFDRWDTTIWTLTNRLWEKRMDASAVWYGALSHQQNCQRAEQAAWARYAEASPTEVDGVSMW